MIPPESLPGFQDIVLSDKRINLAFAQGEELIPHIDVLRRILLSSPGGNQTIWMMPFPFFGFATGNVVHIDPDALFSIHHVKTGESANVYRADDFSEDNPVYLVKGFLVLRLICHSEPSLLSHNKSEQFIVSYILTPPVKFHTDLHLLSLFCRNDFGI